MGRPKDAAVDLLPTVWITCEGWNALLLEHTALGVDHSIDQITVANSWASFSACFKNVRLIANVLHGLWITLGAIGICCVAGGQEKDGKENGNNGLHSGCKLVSDA
jgi:hypothetical protein